MREGGRESERDRERESERARERESERARERASAVHGQSVHMYTACASDFNLSFNVRGAFYRRTGGPMRTEWCFRVRTMRRPEARAAVFPTESALRAAFSSARCP